MNGLRAAGIVAPTAEPSHADRVAALFDAHYERLYRLARRLSATADDASDLVQETFLRAARSSRGLPAGAKDGEAWLVRVLVNIRRDEWRRSSVRERRPAEPAPPVRDHEDAVLARTIVWRALESLAPRRRAVLVMHELEGLPAPGIAAVLGISTITVRWHLSRARRDLARILTGERRTR